MTKERKLYAAVLGLVVAALLVDQVILGGDATGPHDAAAGLPTASTSSATVVPDVAGVEQVVKEMNQAAATLSDDNTLAHRLEAFAAERRYTLPEVTNAFEPDASWVAPATKPKARSTPKTAELFAARHKLTGVMVTGGGGVAMVESKPDGGGSPTRMALRVGQSLDGLTLKSVTDKTATFAGPQVELTLELELPAGRSAPSGNRPAAGATLPGLLK